MIKQNVKTSYFVILVVLCFHCCLLACNAKEKDSAEAEVNKSKIESNIDVLKIGAVPGEQIDNIKEKYQPLCAYLERVLGMKVELFVGTDYTATIEAMRAGKLDIAWYGPFSYVLANKMANAEAFAAESQKELGTFYKSYIVTLPNSGVEKITDVKGKTFAFVDPASTGGYLIPVKHMKEAGIDVDKDLKSKIFLGGHDSCALAVINKQADVASIVKHQYEKAIAEKLFKAEDLKIIHVSDPFPAGPIAWRKDLPDNLKIKIKKAIIEMPEEEFKKLGKMIAKIESFVEIKDSDYDVLREAAKVLNLDLEKMK